MIQIVNVDYIKFSKLVVMQIMHTLFYLHCIRQQLPQPLVRDAEWRRQSKYKDISKGVMSRP